MKLSDFNRECKGQRVFILGDAPQLLRLDDRMKMRLEREVTIGVNYTNLYIQPKYWIAGHLPHVAHAARYGDPSTIKFYQKGLPHNRTWPKKANVVPIKAYVHNYGRPLEVELTDERGISGGEQCLLSATHLALAMGASEIIYIGFEQANQAHFYNIDRKIMHRKKIHMNSLIKQYSKDTVDREMVRQINEHCSKVFKPLEKLSCQPFLGKPIEPKLRFYLLTAIKMGVQIVSTLPTGVIERAGKRKGKNFIAHRKIQDIL